MSTAKQVERMKRSVLFQLSRFPDGIGWYFVLAGYTALGRQIRNHAIDELIREKKVERVGHVLRLAREKMTT